jgi:AcrR family transcriptional regulator
MTKIEEKTKDKIILSALTLIMENGIAKTSLNEVAYHAGVSRVTVYRYFEDKEALVLATFLNVEEIFQDGLKQFQQQPSLTLEKGLDIIGNNLRLLPSGDAVKRADELKRIYPKAYDKIQEVRQATLNKLYEKLSEIGKQQNLFGEGLNREIVRVVFEELIINFFDNPRFKTLALNDADLYYQISHIFLYGVLKSEPEIHKSDL